MSAEILLAPIRPDRQSLAFPPILNPLLFYRFFLRLSGCYGSGHIPVKTSIDQGDRRRREGRRAVAYQLGRLKFCWERGRGRISLVLAWRGMPEKTRSPNPRKAGIAAEDYLFNRLLKFESERPLSFPFISLSSKNAVGIDNLVSLLFFDR